MKNPMRLFVLCLFAALLISLPIVSAQEATVEPTEDPTLVPTDTLEPTEEPTSEVTLEPTEDVTAEPTSDSTAEITAEVTETATPTTPAGTPSSVQPVPLEANAFVTETIPFSEALMNQLTLPDGFTIEVFARDLGNARMIAISDSGVIYISRRMTNDVIALYDQNGDGAADTQGYRIVAENIPFAHGLVIRENRLYIAGEKTIYAADILEDGSLGEREVITENLPDAGQHGNRTIGFAPDGSLMVSIGSHCNACIDSPREAATIVTVPLSDMPGDETTRTIFAEGLRNTIGWDWEPTTGALWGFDHGTDWRGDDAPPEELNQIIAGSHYGWPFCYSDQQVDRYLPYQLEMIRGITNEQFCATTVAPTLEYTAHAAPIAFKFYTADQFPAEYQGDAFVTMRGSWNRYPASGYEVVRVDFENGQPVSIEPFITGFLVENGTAHFARLAGLAYMDDGSMLFTDDTNGILYRVSYSGG